MMGRLAKATRATAPKQAKIHAKRTALEQVKKWPTSKPHKRKEPTAFQRKVYDLISTIPKGKVSTYGAVAASLNSSARAVGNALRNNPFAPKVPCHRVVASDRRLGGFDGQIGSGAPKLVKKMQMLKDEGVHFDTQDPNLVAKESMHLTFSEN